MKIIAENENHRLIHVIRGGINPMRPQNWQLQTRNGKGWGGGLKLFYQMDKAIAAARAVGLDIP
jgi:hypothetical protein